MSTQHSSVPPMRDLAPQIYRQRLVVEGYPAHPITREEIVTYLSELSKVTEMKLLLEAVTHQSPQFGWAGWVHWETSGAHFYAWDQPLLFFSVDVYTCKAFDVQRVVEFTKEFFSTTDIAYREF